MKKQLEQWVNVIKYDTVYRRVNFHSIVVAWEKPYSGDKNKSHGGKDSNIGE